VAEALFEDGNEVVVVDVNERAIDRIARRVTKAAVGDGRQSEILERLGAKNADAAIVSTGQDMSASILSVMALRDLGVPEIYVKVISLDHARVMDRIGVTGTILPERESAKNLASLLSHSNTLLNYVRLGEGFSLQEMAIPDDWEGKTLRELQLRLQYNISVIAIHDVIMDRMVPVPDPDAPLKDSDTLLIAGKDENLEKVARLK
jgi:trk system potassium uptake protein TrkA